MNRKKTFILIALIAVFLTAFGFQDTPEYKILFEKAKFTMETKGDLNGAIKLFNDIIKKYPKEREYAAKSQLYIGICYEKLGVKEAQIAYHKVVNTYPEQTEAVKQANEKLSLLLRAEANSQKSNKLQLSGTDAGGLITRRVLADASGVDGVLTTDGKYIRGMDWETGDVVQYEVASGQKTRITNSMPWSKTETTLGDQMFSRDGNQIVYSVESSDPNTKDWLYQLRIRNLDGSGLRTFYSEKDSYVYPLDWSPDAQSILAARSQNKADELILISTTDGSVRVLRSITSGWMGLLMASFSPDGKFITFSSVREGSSPQSDIFLMTADGRNEVVVAGHPAEDQLLQWTPDGKSLLFLSDRTGTWDIWTVRITEGKQQGEPELLKKDFGYDSEVLGFAHDGSLYYKTVTRSGGLYSGGVDLETGKVLVPPTPVTTRYTGLLSQPLWSPDGKNLLYISQRSGVGPGNNILTIRSAETGEERFLSPRLRFVNMHSWAPDGRSIIALGITMGTETGIFRIDAETSAITKLADGGLFPKLCPDGKTLLFADGPIIWKLNLDTGQKLEVVNAGTGGTAQWLYDLSPDGREVVFQKDSTVNIVSLNGGEPREIFHGKARNYKLKWTGDGRYILVRAGSVIRRVPAQGGTPLKLDLSIPKMESFTLHPDNHRFAFTVNDGSKSELWVMENFLPK
jgi:Tol biopolymer transport system component